MAPEWRASGAPGIGRHAAGGSCPGVLLFRLLLSLLSAACIAASVAAGYHDTTPGNWGGAYREDDVDIWAEEGGSS